MQHDDISGMRMPPGKKGLTSLFRAVLFVMAVTLIYSLYPVTPAHASPAPQVCPDGKTPTKYGTAKGKRCTRLVDLSKAVDVINWAIKSPPRYYTQRPGYRRAERCNLSYSDRASRVCGAGSPRPGFCPAYDCSSLAAYVAAQVPGYSRLSTVQSDWTEPEWYAVDSKPVADWRRDPVIWCFKSGGDGGGHVYVRIGQQHVGNAHGCSEGMPEIDGNISRGFEPYCRVPPGLDYLSNSCVCGTGYSTTRTLSMLDADGEAPPAECNLENYYEFVADFESSCCGGYTAVNQFGCGGKYQFCDGTLTRYWDCAGSSLAGWTSGKPSANQCQEDGMRDYTEASWNYYLGRNLDRFLGRRMKSKSMGWFTVTQGAMLAGGQFSRIWVQDFLESNGADDYTDGNGFYVSDYMAKGALTVVDDEWVNMQGYPTGATGCEQPDEPTVPRIKPVLPVDIGLDKQGFVPYAKEWWKKEFLPALKDMASQIYAYRVFETWQLGRMMDAQDINRTARAEQEQRVTAQQRYTPNEQVCIAGSYPFSMSQSPRIAEALTDAFKNDLQKRGANFIDEIFGEAVGPNPTQDQEYRWKEYCREFHDPDNNNREWQGACPNPTGPGRAAPNGDISIEGFLLKDTIDMSDPNGYEYVTAQALLKNLVQPIVVARIPDDTIDTAVGKEYLLIIQRLEAINSIATDVVASIISRRTALAPNGGNNGGKGPGELIWEIRKRAGTIDPNLPAPTTFSPSYNEIMLAMTKERFFDPQYFIRMANNIGAIKQEQTAVNSYITIQMQDIYKLQEQINALLAARASLNLMPDSAGSQVDAAPVK